MATNDFPNVTSSGVMHRQTQALAAEEAKRAQNEIRDSKSKNGYRVKSLESRRRLLNRVLLSEVHCAISRGVNRSLEDLVRPEVQQQGC